MLGKLVSKLRSALFVEKTSDHSMPTILRQSLTLKQDSEDGMSTITECSTENCKPCAEIATKP